MMSVRLPLFSTVSLPANVWIVQVCLVWEQVSFLFCGYYCNSLVVGGETERLA